MALFVTSKESLTLSSASCMHIMHHVYTMYAGSQCIGSDLVHLTAQAMVEV